MSKGSIRMIAMGDLHCGHMVGLTHPDFNYVSNLSSPLARKLRQIRNEGWLFYANQLKKLGTPDIMIVNGDLIDGKGDKSGGSELIASGMKEQTEIAKAAIETAKCKNVYLTFGTAYHVSPDGEDREADLVDGKHIKKIGSHEFLNIQGHTFDAKHHIGSSSTPYARATPIAKDMTWNKLWNGNDEMQPLADVTLRSHVHYFTMYGDWYAGRVRTGYTMPALQAMGSKFGARRCSGTVDFGFLVFDITKERVVCTPKIASIKAQKATVLIV